ncbi:N-6 DNA methylase [Bernardetia sp. ABR2-2B]|uniref:Eco57I restriction-modification methylase domain-containing protein n=1 Tax=Bernardetia sp. ABR2-2B TaxID=3127472 RepID=UPI0030CF3F29
MSYSEGNRKGKKILNAYFTPKEICEQMWELAKVHGYDGGTVLEPSVGTGNMIVHAPNKTKVTGLETEAEYFETVKDRFPTSTFYNVFFEQVFLQPERYRSDYEGNTTWLKGYPFDLIIGNPPYGKFTGRWASYFPRRGEPKFQNYEYFFMWYGLKLLKKGGLLVYIIPQNFLNTGFNSYKKQKEAILKVATLVDAYEMGSIFKDTKVPTHIIVLKKK